MASPGKASQDLPQRRHTFALANRLCQLRHDLDPRRPALGYSPSFQGEHERADQLFDESAGVDVPTHTLSANKLLEARTAFRHGQRSQAFQILRSYIDDLLETNNLIAASVVCIDFINMMATIDHLAAVAHMLAYLETINDFGALASRTRVAEAARKVAANAAHTTDPRADGHHLDDRHALEYMRGVLDELGRGRTWDDPRAVPPSPGPRNRRGRSTPRRCTRAKQRVFSHRRLRGRLKESIG